MSNFIIKTLETKDFIEYARIKQNSYPNFFEGTERELVGAVDRLKNLKTGKDVEFFGFYEDNKLKGCLTYYAFDLNFHGDLIKAGGIGALGVNLLYKKQKIAQNLINHSLAYAKNNNMHLFMLYPFNAKFYRNFGFGYGNKISLYKIKPEHFMDFKDKSMLETINNKEVNNIIKFYNNTVNIQHGMMRKTTSEILKMKNDEKSKTIICIKDSNIKGYCRFYFEKIDELNNLNHKMVIEEIIYESPKTLKQFSTFFNSLKDQVKYIELHTFDDNFPYILEDVYFYTEPKKMPIIHHKNCDNGIGLMYKANDIDNLLNLISNKIQTNIKFNIRDLYNNKTDIYFLGNKDNIDCELVISINDFSSWIMGCVKLNSLYNLGLVDTKNPELLKSIDYQLNFDKPTCLTSF